MRPGVQKFAEGVDAFLDELASVLATKPQAEEQAPPVSKPRSKSDVNKIINTPLTAEERRSTRSSGLPGTGRNALPLANEGLSESADGDGQTNNYQIMFQKLGMRPFDLNKAAGCFKQGSAMDALTILCTLEKEGLARRMDDPGTLWVLDKA